jgi:hypothetical protein
MRRVTGGKDRSVRFFCELGIVRVQTARLTNQSDKWNDVPW